MFEENYTMYMGSGSEEEVPKPTDNEDEETAEEVVSNLPEEKSVEGTASLSV